MNNLKINQDKLITILINEIIDLKANTLATQSVLIGVIKVLKPEIYDSVVQLLQEQTANYRQQIAQQFQAVLGAESLDLQHYLQSLINQ